MNIPALANSVVNLAFNTVDSVLVDATYVSQQPGTYDTSSGLVTPTLVTKTIRMLVPTAPADEGPDAPQMIGRALVKAAELAGIQPAVDDYILEPNGTRWDVNGFDLDVTGNLWTLRMTKRTMGATVTMPSDIPNLIGWWESDFGVTVVGGRAYFWRSRPTPATPVSQPTFGPVDGNNSDLPIYGIYGNDDLPSIQCSADVVWRILTAIQLSTILDEVTAIMAVRIRAGAGDGILLSKVIPSENAFTVNWYSTNGSVSLLASFPDMLIGTGADYFPAGTFRMVTVKAAAHSAIRVNGFEAASGIFQGAMSQLPALTIGAGGDDESEIQPLNVNYLGLLLYNRGLTDSEMAQAENYFNLKFAGCMS